jgi:hypothetical protein
VACGFAVANERGGFGEVAEHGQREFVLGEVIEVRDGVVEDGLGAVESPEARKCPGGNGSGHRVRPAEVEVVDCGCELVEPTLLMTEV